MQGVRDGEITVAVIGVGYLGRFHAEKLASMPGVQLVAVVDTDTERAQAMARAHGCAAHTDHHALLGAVDAACVVVPTVLHHVVAGDFLRAGAHVLVEKPIARTLAEADALVALAKTHERLLQVGHLQRFNPAFWLHFEKRVEQLRDMGIEADIIIFHPYDRWGFKSMGHENNLFYLRYLVARLAAYRNVWWSLANEYDFLKWPMEHWDAYFQFITTPGIEPTNNLAEQALRFVVIDRRITQGTRSPRGRHWSERIWTTIATCSQQSRSVFHFLHRAIHAHFTNRSVMQYFIRRDSVGAMAPLGKPKVTPIILIYIIDLRGSIPRLLT